MLRFFYSVALKAIDTKGTGNKKSIRVGNSAESMSLTELPFHLPGRIFRSPMPFSVYDPRGDSLLRFKQEKGSLIVLLAEEEECMERAGRNLKSLYLQEGFQVIHLPIPDFDVPSKEDLEEVVRKTVEHAQAARNILIHCHAGVGRTGLFVAYLAKQVLGLSSEEAIRWTREYIPGALDTDQQRKWFMNDGA
ncbi:MAG: dual specificity protein phosphatase family protein [Syntrophorhabdales bacterium]|jgi:protein-tyrosine phosphatase